MNARFSYLWLRYLNTKRQGGFAMMIAIVLGLVMLVVGVTLLVQSSGNQTKTISKAKSDKAFSIAEAGATQYVDFLNKKANRILLSFDDCVATRDANGSCPDSGTGTKSWSLADNILTAVSNLQGGNACTNATGSTAVSTIQTWANANNTTGWRTIGDGRFKLVGYKYTPDGAANSVPGTAVLAVQGINGTTGTADSANGGTQVQMTLRINSNPSSTPPIPQSAPGLWARSFSTAADIHANVLDSSGCTSGNTPVSSSLLNYLPSLPLGTLPNGNHTPALSGTMGQLVKETNGTPFPPLPYYPATADANTNTLSNCSGKTAYPANGDKDADGNTFNSSSPPGTGKVYKYRITGGCTLPSGVTFGSRGDDRVIMYIDSTLDIGNNAKVATSGGTQAKVQWLLRTSDLDLGGNSQVGSASPDASTATNWSFFLYSCTDVACTSRKSSPEVSLRGTSDYYAFIFAPYATADMRGNPKIAGALWVNRFETNGSPPKIFQAMQQNDFNQLFSGVYSDTGTDVSLLQNGYIGNTVAFNKTSFNASVVPVAAP
ncbi:hypothetical protein [Synechocystis sp. LKSZ1]|uniref:DUF7305 domain-containing protein n=1 Tax=Synechocystis sp. LKSZ1 TaxID=3144951 RepID=UPI00336C0BC7